MQRICPKEDFDTILDLQKLVMNWNKQKIFFKSVWFLCLRPLCFKYQIVLCRTIFWNTERLELFLILFCGKNLTGILFHNNKNTTENFFICTGCSHILPSNWVTCDSCPQIIEPSKTESCGQKKSMYVVTLVCLPDFFFIFMYYFLCPNRSKETHTKDWVWEDNFLTWSMSTKRERLRSKLLIRM